MTLFEAVKQSVTTRQAAEHYHFRVSRSGFISCPFHNDRTPSMKVDNRFHCFGCGADGDVIDFVARLNNLNAKSAAEKLAADFRIPYEKTGWRPKVIQPAQKTNEEQQYRKLESRCFRVLSDYLHLLRQWETDYAPKPEDETWHPLFVEALQKKDYIEYLLDVLQREPLSERAALIQEHGKEVIKLEQRISDLAARTERKPENDGGDPNLSDRRGSENTPGTQRQVSGEKLHAQCISGLYG